MLLYNHLMKRKDAETMAVIINLRGIDEDFHRRLRVRAAELGVTIKALVVRYCEEGMKRDKAKKK